MLTEQNRPADCRTETNPSRAIEALHKARRSAVAARRRIRWPWTTSAPATAALPGTGQEGRRVPRPRNGKPLRRGCGNGGRQRRRETVEGGGQVQEDGEGRLAGVPVNEVERSPPNPIPMRVVITDPNFAPRIARYPAAEFFRVAPNDLYVVAARRRGRSSSGNHSCKDSDAQSLTTCAGMSWLPRSRTGFRHIPDFGR